MKRTALLAITILLPVFGAMAQTETPPTVPPAESADWQSYDSAETRELFNDVLSRHPREVGVILKLDPSLFGNEAWIASYPALGEFVSQHPEVARNPSYYLERVWIPGDDTPEPASVRAARQMMEGVAIFGVMLTLVGALVWLIRTLIEHRRWSRVSRVQTEIYNKLLDRFTSHEDLLRYVQSAAGRDFIQSATSPISTGTPAPVSAPVSRILWSLQAGVILFALGLGLQIVSGRLHPDVGGSISTLGVLALCGGLGFAASAVVAWIVSRRLGVLPVSEVEAETGSLRERTLGE
jgi:hypothetical protein